MDSLLPLLTSPLTPVLVGLGLALTVACWALWIEPAGLRNETRRLVVPGWPAANGPLRIAVIADLHVGSPWNGLDRLQRVVRVAQAARPDLILLAGDFVITEVRWGHFVAPEAIAEHLGRLSAPLGVHAVLGNHDWWYDGPRVAAALRRSGVRVLQNEAVKLVGEGRSFWLAGLDDFWAGTPDLEGTLRQVSDSDPIILLTHNPDIFPTVPARVALTIAGHTHGGQVRLPLIGRPVVPSVYGARYAAGEVCEEGRHLFVTPGVGTSILGIRFRVPPEVSVLDITCRATVPAAVRRGRSWRGDPRRTAPSPASSWRA